jgi:hypothetical protein
MKYILHFPFFFLKCLGATIITLIILAIVAVWFLCDLLWDFKLNKEEYDMFDEHVISLGDEWWLCPFYKRNRSKTYKYTTILHHVWSMNRTKNIIKTYGNSNNRLYGDQIAQS